MTTMRFKGDGIEAEIDLGRFTLNEAILVEEQTGLDVEAIGTKAQQRNLRAVGALLWIARLRQIMAEQGITLDQAAAALPRAAFDVNLIGMEVTAEDPTGAPTPGPTTPTSPRTSGSSSAHKPKARGGRNNATSTSASSPTSSESAPGKSDA